MNNKQLKMIYRLIDIHTKEIEVYRDCFELQIDRDGIRKLKEDIALFFDKENKNETD